MEQNNMMTGPEEIVFRNPPVQYRGIPFWSWNCRVTEELIDWQLDCFAKMGFGGVDIHPRTGLDTEYLGEEYMRLVAYTVKRCREKGLLCWLYDEDRFPSGNAGGLVTKDFRMRGRFLLLTEKDAEGGVLPGYCRDRESFEQAVERGEKPLGYYVTAYGLSFCEGRLREYHRLYTGEDIRKARGKGERIRFAYVKIMEEEQWFEAQAYVDTMNPEAIARFLELTHEAYYRETGSEFGKTVPAIFTDEPRLGKHAPISCALSGEDVSLPYTDYLAEQMERRYGIDPLDIAPEYIWERIDGEYVNRYRYRETAAECFVSAYMDQISEWCGGHGIAMTGHVLGEDTLEGQAMTVGDCMRCYRKMEIPGIDILLDSREFNTVKQAVSVARQNGKKDVASELYGVTHWDCDFVTYKLQGDWQAALGVTVRVPHLSYMSMQGEAKRDWPASIFYQSPWYEEFPYIEDYFARINTVLTRGRAVVKTAVLHPVESMWICSGPNDQTGETRAGLDRDFRELTEWLLYGAVDFDFLSESLLPQQCSADGQCPSEGQCLVERQCPPESQCLVDGQYPSESQCLVERQCPPEGQCLVDGQYPSESRCLVERQMTGILQVGCMAYSAVVVPGLKTIRSTTLDILEAFRARGGKIIFVGRIPDMVEGEKSDRALKLAAVCSCIPKEKGEVLQALEEERVLEIRKENGNRSDNLFYQMREEGDVRWLFICHVNRRKSGISAAEVYEVRIKGHYRVMRYDAMTGETDSVSARQEEGSTVLELNMYREDSILLRLSAERACGKEKPVSGNVATSEVLAAMNSGDVSAAKGSAIKAEETVRTVMKLSEPCSVRRLEPNVLLLDYARWQLDGGGIQLRQEILKADNEIRRRLGFALRRERMYQPWFMEEKETHRVTLYYNFVSETEAEASLAIEDFAHSKVILNGEAVEMCPVGWYVDPAISVVRLPGLQAGVNRLTVEIAYNQKSGLENLYILGDFDVELCGSRAVIKKERKNMGIGDITRQGMPFYTGNLEYTFPFEADRDGVSCHVHIPGFKAPALAVYLDGKRQGLVAYAPNRLQLEPVAAGRHELTLRLYGSRFNGFGTLHNANENFVWYGPDSYRTEGDDWTDCYLVRPAGIMAAVEMEG